jgi:hypothetical protein
MEITAETTFNKFRIRIDGIIQLSISRDIEAMQSWQMDRTYYGLELQTKNGTTTRYEYDSKEKWEKVIQELEKHEVI